MDITASAVKDLRDRTGAGMMDCKKALQESNGDVEKAIEYLRKKGIMKASTRQGRETNEGRVECYIHPGNRLGVLVEVNTETDFVAKTDDFIELCKNVAMHIAASNPIGLRREDIDPSLLEKELEIYRAQAAEQGKPANIVDRIAQGKLEKFYQETCLLEQAYIRDQEKTVNDIVMAVAGKLGENINIKRFVRFQLGG